MCACNQIDDSCFKRELMIIQQTVFKKKKKKKRRRKRLKESLQLFNNSADLQPINNVNTMELLDGCSFADRSHFCKTVKLNIIIVCILSSLLIRTGDKLIVDATLALKPLLATHHFNQTFPNKIFELCELCDQKNTTLALNDNQLFVAASTNNVSQLTSLPATLPEALALSMSAYADLTSLNSASQNVQQQFPATNEQPFASMLYSAVINEKVSLPCDINPPSLDDSVALILWYKDDSLAPIVTIDARKGALEKAKLIIGDSLANRASFNTKDRPAYLQIDPVKLIDAGSYRCRVDFQKGRSVNTLISLMVVVKPELVKITNTNNEILQGLVGPFNEGDELQLICTAIGGTPRPELVWKVDYSTIDESFQYVDKEVTNNELIIPSLNRHHLLSVFECQAKNNNITSPLSASITLDLNLKPNEVSIKQLSETLIVGQTATFECVAFGSRPHASIYWIFQGKRHDPPMSVDQQTTSRLTLTMEKSFNNKNLTCLGENPKIQSSALRQDLKLDVHYAPQLSIQLDTAATTYTSIIINNNNNNNNNEDTDQLAASSGESLHQQQLLNQLQEGNDIYIQCQIDANPRPTKPILWKFNGKHLSATPGIIQTNHSLVLQKVTRLQSGQYQCEVTNIHGTNSSQSIQLRIRHAPVCSHEDILVYGVRSEQTVLIECNVIANPVNSVQYSWIYRPLNGLASKLHENDRSNESSAIESLFKQTDQQPQSNKMGQRLEETSQTLRYNMREMHSDSHGYGTIECIAKNDIGLQQKACKFQIRPPARPEFKHNCVTSNSSISSLNVNCYAHSHSDHYNQLEQITRGGASPIMDNNKGLSVVDDSGNNDLSSRQQLNDLMILNGHQPSKQPTNNNYNGKHLTHSSSGGGGGATTPLYRYVYPLTWFVCEVYEVLSENTNVAHTSTDSSDDAARSLRNNNVQMISTDDLATNQQQQKNLKHLNLVYNLSISSAQNLPLVRSLVSPTTVDTIMNTFKMGALPHELSSNNNNNNNNQMKFISALMTSSGNGAMMGIFAEDIPHSSNLHQKDQPKYTSGGDISNNLQSTPSRYQQQNLIDNDFMFIVSNLTSASAFKLKIYSQNSFDRSNEHIWLSGRTLEPQYLRHSTSGARINDYDQTKTSINGGGNINSVDSSGQINQIMTIDRSSLEDTQDDIQVITINKNNGDRQLSESLGNTTSYGNNRFKHYWSISVKYVKTQPILLIIVALSAFMIVIIAIVGPSVAYMRTRRQHLVERITRQRQQQQQQQQHQQHQQHHDGSDTAGSDCNELVGSSKLSSNTIIVNGRDSLPRIIKSHPHSDSVESSNSSRVSSASSSASAALLGMNHSASVDCQLRSINQTTVFLNDNNGQRRASHGQQSPYDLDNPMVGLNPTTQLIYHHHHHHHQNNAGANDDKTAILRSKATGRNNNNNNKSNCFHTNSLLGDGHYYYTDKQQRQQQQQQQQQCFDGHQIVDAYDLAVQMQLNQHHQHHLKHHHHQQQQQQQHENIYRLPVSAAGGQCKASSHYTDANGDNNNIQQLEASDLLALGDTQHTQYQRYLNCGTLPNIRHLASGKVSSMGHAGNQYQQTLNHQLPPPVNINIDTHEDACDRQRVLHHQQQQQPVQQLTNLKEQVALVNCSESIYSASSMSGSSPLPMSHTTSTTDGGVNQCTHLHHTGHHHHHQQQQQHHHHGHLFDQQQHGQLASLVEAGNCNNNLQLAATKDLEQPHHCQHHLSALLISNQNSSSFGTCSESNNDDDHYPTNHDSLDNECTSHSDNLLFINGQIGGEYGDRSTTNDIDVDLSHHLQQQQHQHQHPIYYIAPSSGGNSERYIHTNNQQQQQHLCKMAPTSGSSCGSSTNSNQVASSAKECVSSSQTSADTDSSLNFIMPTLGGPTSADSGISGNHSVSSSNASQISIISHHRQPVSQNLDNIGRYADEQQMGGCINNLAIDVSIMGSSTGSIGSSNNMQHNQENIKQVHFEMDNNNNKKSLKFKMNRGVNMTHNSDRQDNSTAQKDFCANIPSSLDVSPMKNDQMIAVLKQQSTRELAPHLGDQLGASNDDNNPIGCFSSTTSTSSPSSNMTLSDITNVGVINSMII